MKLFLIFGLAILGSLSIAQGATKKPAPKPTPAPILTFPATFRTDQCVQISQGDVTKTKKAATLKTTTGQEKVTWTQDGVDYKLNWFLETYNKTFGHDVGIIAWKSTSKQSDDQGRITEENFALRTWFATFQGKTSSQDDTEEIQASYSDSGIETDAVSIDGKAPTTSTMQTQQLQAGERKTVTVVKDELGQDVDGPYNFQSTQKTCTEKDLTQAQIAKYFKTPMLTAIKTFSALLGKVDQTERDLVTCKAAAGSPDCSKQQADVDAAVKARDAKWAVLINAKQLAVYVRPPPPPTNYGGGGDDNGGGNDSGGGDSSGGSGGGSSGSGTTICSGGICNGPGGTTICSGGICNGPGGTTICSGGICNGPGGTTICSGGICNGPGGTTICSGGICNGSGDGGAAACGAGISCP